MDKYALSPEEQIEYYLGKDRLPNLHWKAAIPEAWSILPHPEPMLLCGPDLHNTTVHINNIDYYFNNLGYRSNFDFDVAKLKNKKIILVLGDSDTSGKGLNFEDMYSTKIQSNTDDCVMNLAIPGLSADGMSRIGSLSILALGSAVKHVCVFWPVASLREFVSKKFKSGVHNLSTVTPYSNWWDHIDWISNNYNYQKNRLLLEQTTSNIGAQYHELIINRYDEKNKVTYNQNGIFTELTAESHTAIAQYYLRKINNKPSLYKQITQS